jgi:hypothetical protein
MKGKGTNYPQSHARLAPGNHNALQLAFKACAFSAVLRGHSGWSAGHHSAIMRARVIS